jgi:hypothetical protein
MKQLIIYTLAMLVLFAALLLLMAMPSILEWIGIQFGEITLWVIIVIIFGLILNKALK